MVRGHRRDIDGLRAVAILPVLLYHANVWPFAGGYVGVDVFFVISGYLITGLILREHQGAGFSLADFYDRRIRRIMPALGVVLACSTLAALVILLPDELVDFGESLASAALFCANILFWTRKAAYFAADAGDNPLLHIWSLAVEEQFYLLWPLLLVFLARRGRQLPWISVLAVASFVFALFYARSDPSGAFYLLPARAWQLLLGAFLAAGGYAVPRNVVVRNGIAVAGFAAIAAAALIPGDKALYHPLNALGAALGASAILYAAEGGDTFVSTALATRLPVFIGTISYSLYLWHWPLLVFAKLALGRELAPSETAAILILAFLASVASWKYVEQPARRRPQVFSPPRKAVRFAAAGSAAALVAAAVLSLSGGLVWRLPADIRAISAEAHVVSGRWCPADSEPLGCVLGAPAATTAVMLWGDSHARALVPAIDDLARARDMRLLQITSAACPPLLGLTLLNPDGVAYPACDRQRRTALARILGTPSIKLVVLAARWQIYISDRIVPRAGAVPALGRSLGGLADTLTRHGKSVLLIADVPVVPFKPDHCYGRDRIFARDPARCLTIPADAARAAIAPAQAEVEQVAASHHIRFYDPKASLCDAHSCYVFSAGHVLYADTHHLSAAGARLALRGLGNL
jgi:peptidoglycan/LPS O-acetylase OafA/YrhL